MSEHKKTFYDIYSAFWEFVDKPRKKLRFWDRMRMKQLLNQLLRQYQEDVWKPKR